MAKKKKKKTTILSPEAKAKLRTGFATLINNDACIKASREWKGAWNFLPIGLAIGAIVLALTPTFVQRMSVLGGKTFFSTPTYEMERGLESFSEAAYLNTVHVKVQNGEIVTENWDAIATNPSDPEIKWYQHFNSETQKLDFEVFFNNSTKTDDAFITAVFNNKNPYTDQTRPTASKSLNPIVSSEGRKALSDESSEAVSESSVSEESITSSAAETSVTSGGGSGKKDLGYITNVVVFGKNKIRAAKFKTNESTVNYIDLTLERLEGQDVYEIGKKLATNPDQTSEAKIKLAKTLWMAYFNAGYETMKQKSAWTWTGTMAATYAALVVIFTLVIFLLTRGKKNPYRVYTLWDTAKIACWATVAPAILSLIGFITASYSFFFFIVLYGLRVMWMTMKVFSPARNAPK